MARAAGGCFPSSCVLTASSVMMFFEALISASSCGLGLEKGKRCAIDSDVMIWSLGSRVGELTVGVNGECKRGVSGAEVCADV